MLRLSPREYPVLTVADRLLQTLNTQRRVVLSAPPGSGKTTALPLALLSGAYAPDKKILIVEPRRLAATAAANRMSQLLEEPTGQTVGVRTRVLTQCSKNSVIELLTDGIILRMLQNDPLLENVQLVIFDEFHERSLAADTALTLLRETLEAREDLQVLVMSATLDAEKIGEFLSAPVISCPGTQYPVQTIYRSGSKTKSLAEKVADGILHALQEQSGSILAFLPGEAWIAECADRLRTPLQSTNCELHLLYGRLDYARQSAAIAPCPPPRRKIVLATAIAESSLTIDGIQIVVDGGFTRIMHYNPANHLSSLETVRISQAAAEQRRGRAGRTAPGVVYRLWTPEEQALLPPFDSPEILTADLMPLALELAAWGTPPQQLHWLTPPPEALFASATKSLQRLGAIGEKGNLTECGTFLLHCGIHPRLGKMLWEGKQLRAAGTALKLAILLTEGNLQRSNCCDLEILLTHPLPRQQQDLLNRLAGKLQMNPKEYKDELCGVLLSFAYPERIARKKNNHYLLATGRGAISSHHQDEFLVAAVTDGGSGKTTGTIHMAAALTREEIEKYHAAHIKETKVLEFNEQDHRFEVIKRRMLDSLILQEQPGGDLTPEERIAAQIACLRTDQTWLKNLPEALQKWRERVQFLQRNLPEDNWPDLSDNGLLQQLEEFILPFLPPHIRKNFADSIDWNSALHALVPYQKKHQMEQLVPEYFVAPSGRKHKLDYSGEKPVLTIKLQELFGLAQTPMVLNNRCPVLLHLCSPAGRVVQITEDLVSFWNSSYFLVRNELKGRYPKHPWPDDPWNAKPTANVKAKS